MKPRGTSRLLAKVALCAALILAFPACGGDNETQGLEGPKWVLTAYLADGSIQQALPSPPVEATFADGRVNGTGGCNLYSGSYQLDGDKLSIGLLISTQRACEPPILDQETAYYRDLQSAGSYQIDTNTLTIRDGSGTTVLDFHADGG
jgi:heat shock protein HslJ